MYSDLRIYAFYRLWIYIIHVTHSFYDLIIGSGSDNYFTLVAVTKHSIGNSRPSRPIRVRCPNRPVPVNELYQVDTDETGVILLTWQVGYSGHTTVQKKLLLIISMEEQKKFLNFRFTIVQFLSWKYIKLNFTITIFLCT